MACLTCPSDVNSLKTKLRWAEADLLWPIVGSHRFRSDVVVAPSAAPSGGSSLRDRPLLSRKMGGFGSDGQSLADAEASSMDVIASAAAEDDVEKLQDLMFRHGPRNVDARVSLIGSVILERAHVRLPRFLLKSQPCMPLFPPTRFA